MRVVAVLVLVGVALGVAPRPARADGRSKEGAILLSAAGTAAPFAVGYGVFALEPDRPSAGRRVLGRGLLAATILVGPAAGHWYAGDYWTTGTTVRSGGLLAIALSLVMLPDCDSGPDCPPMGTALAAGALFVAGLGALAVGAGIDIVTAPDAVERHHDAAARAHVLSIGGRF